MQLDNSLLNTSLWKEKRVFSPFEAWVYLLTHTTREVNGEVICARYRIGAFMRKTQWEPDEIIRFLSVLESEEKIVWDRSKHLVQIIKPERFLIPGGVVKKRKRIPKKTASEGLFGDRVFGEQDIFSHAKTIFMNHYRQMYEQAYYWEAKDAFALTQVLKKMIFVCRNKNPNVTENEVVNAFRILIESIQDRWIINNFSMSIINSKFNELIAHARQSSQKGSRPAPPSQPTKGGLGVMRPPNGKPTD